MLLGEVAHEASHMWVADKVTRIAWRLKLIEDMDGYLADPDLDPHLRSGECGSFSATTAAMTGGTHCRGRQPSWTLP